MSEVLRWLERRRGNKITELLEKHLSLVRECVYEAERGLESFVRGNIEEAMQHFTLSRRKESEADDVRRRLVEEVEWGRLPPADREDILHVVRRLDSVANWTKEAVRILSLVDPKCIPEVLKEGIVKMAKLNSEGIRLLGEAIEALTYDPRKAIKLTQEVENIESQADERDLENRKVLLKVDNIKFQTALLLFDFLHALEEASDAEEDTADYIKGIAVRKL